MSVAGVASVDVNLEKGLASVKMKPGNSATLKQLQEAITKNGFTMKESRVVASGKLIQEGNQAKLQISGSNDVVTLTPESSAHTLPAAPSTAIVIVEGSIPEAAKGKSPDSMRYRTINVQK
jgi:hypothetical protein